MNVKLDHILTGITMRRTHPHSHGFIQGLAEAIHQPTGVESMTRPLRDRVSRPENLTEDDWRQWTTQAHDGDSPLARGGRLSDDGILGQSSLEPGDTTTHLSGSSPSE